MAGGTVVATGGTGWMSAGGQAPHVLVVDDEAVSALALARFLERRGGLRVTVAHDGLGALEAHGADPADVLVTDMRMPRMGGAELAARLREALPRLPVVVVTGYSGELPAVAALGAPLEVMHKPVDPAAVLAAVRRLAVG